MNIAFILFDNITLPDFIGCYDPISRLQKEWMPSLRWKTLPSISLANGADPMPPTLLRLKWIISQLPGFKKPSFPVLVFQPSRAVTLP